MTTTDVDANVDIIIAHAEKLGIDVNAKPEDMDPEDWIMAIVGNVLWEANKAAEWKLYAGASVMEMINRILVHWDIDPITEDETYRDGFQRFAECLRLMDGDRQ